MKIVDFGIAKAAPRIDSPLEGQKATGIDTAAPLVTEALPTGVPQGQTIAGNVMGTPGFMAPEQIQGLQLDVRADPYALGCMLYEMIGGEPVFTASDTTAVLMKHLVVSPPPLRKRIPSAGVTDAIDELIGRLLAKEPAQRFSAMRQVEQALQREIDLLWAAAGKRPVTTDKLGGLGRLRRRVPLWLLASGLGAVLLGLGLGAYHLLQRPQAAVAMQSRELAELRRRALAVVAKNLKASQPELQREAIAALGQTRDQTLRPQLEGLLQSADPPTRTAAAAALGALGDRRAIAALAALLTPASGKPREPPQVAAAAAASLRELGDARGQRFLEQQLDTNDPDIQLRTALLLCDQGPPDLQRVQRGYLQRPGLPLQTQITIWACLARAGDATALTRLRTEVAGVGPTRLPAAVKLAQLGEAEGFRYLRELARKRGQEQLISARELALLDESDGLELFRQLVQSRGAASLPRQLASQGLGAVGEPSDARQLAAVMDEPGEPQLELAAAHGILQITGRDPGLLSAQSLSWASDALGASDALTRQSAADILGDSVNAGAVSLLAGLLGDKDTQVRRSAARALGKQQADTAVLALKTALGDGDQGGRLDALRALLRIGAALKRPTMNTAAPQLRAALEARIEVIELYFGTFDEPGAGQGDGDTTGRATARRLHVDQGQLGVRSTDWHTAMQGRVADHFPGTGRRALAVLGVVHRESTARAKQK